MRAPILAAALLAATSGSRGQAVLVGRVVEAGGRHIADAHARWEGARDGAVSDARGNFRLPLPEGPRGVLVVSHTGHATVQRQVYRSRIGTDTVTIVLAVQPVELGPFEVAARTAPEPVFQRADVHVGAYAVNDDGLWVLAYEKPQLWHREERAGEDVLLASRMVLLDTDFREVAAIGLPAPAKRIVRDHAQRVIAEGEREAWLALRDEDGLRLQRMDAAVLREHVLPWTDSTAGRVFGSNRTEDFPAFDHLLHRFDDGSDRLICSVQDEFVMDLFRSQYKYMSGREKVLAMDMELATGVDREVIAGFMTGFQHDKYFKVPYAPLFRLNDTLCVFDHAKGAIRWFSLDGAALGEAPMKHQRDRSFRRLLLHDTSTGRVHALFQRGPVAMLRTVDPRSGALGPEQPLTHPFPSEVQVHDGHAYYVYRPFGSLQKRTLYRERLAE